MGTKARGRILFWEGASLWILSAAPGQTYPKTDPHSHHVLQVTLALTGSIALEVAGERVSSELVAVQPNAKHAFEGTGLVAHVFIAPDSDTGRRIAHNSFGSRSVASIPVARLGDLPSRLRDTFGKARTTDEELRHLGRQIIDRLANDTKAPPRGCDPRIPKLAAWMATRLDESLSLRDAAEFLGLSQGRARHLFVQSTGLPFRTYLLWLRLMRAVELYASSASLTQAAHGAGFADSAHLSRTFRRMFGIAAASLQLG